MTRSPIWHPFTQHGLCEPIPTIVRAEGLAMGDAARTAALEQAQAQIAGLPLAAAA